MSNFILFLSIVLPRLRWIPYKIVPSSLGICLIIEGDMTTKLCNQDMLKIFYHFAQIKVAKILLSSLCVTVRGGVRNFKLYVQCAMIFMYSFLFRIVSANAMNKPIGLS